jgi:hypothetical protein
MMAEAMPTSPTEHAADTAPIQERGDIVSKSCVEDKPLQQVTIKTVTPAALETNPDQGEDSNGNEEVEQVGQQSSLLLNLSGEIRNKIWRMCLIYAPVNGTDYGTVKKNRHQSPDYYALVDR